MECKYIRGRKYDDNFPMTPHVENYNGKDEADIHESLKEKLANVTSSKLKNDVEYRKLHTEYQYADSWYQYCLKNPPKFLPLRYYFGKVWL